MRNDSRITIGSNRGGAPLYCSGLKSTSNTTSSITAASLADKYLSPYRAPMPLRKWPMIRSTAFWSVVASVSRSSMRCLREWNTFAGVLTPMVGVNSSFHQRLYLHFGHMRPFLDSLTRDATQSSKPSRIRLSWIATFRMLDSVLVDFWFPYPDS